jgi:hypothetical protein
MKKEQLRDTAETQRKSPQPNRHIPKKGAGPLSGADE